MKECFIPKNFNADAITLIDKINDILRAYARQGYDLSLRQTYYQLVSRNIVPNTEQSYKRVGGILSDARLAGLVDWGMIVDRGRETTQNGHWESAGDIVEACARQFMYDTWADQPWHVEVMVEKQALEGVLEPVCKSEDVPFTANKGYSSSSAMHGAGKRLRLALEAGRNVRVIYLGDHDPSGIDMTRDVGQRLKMFAGFTEYDVDDDSYYETGAFGGVEFEVDRIALNMDQIDEYNPPPNPAKTTDSRSAGYIERFGNESWELDALEPAVLAGLVRQSIWDRRDMDIWDKSIARRDRARQALTDLAATIDDEIDETEEPE